MPGAIVAVGESTMIVAIWVAEHQGEVGFIFLNDYALGSSGCPRGTSTTDRCRWIKSCAGLESPASKLSRARSYAMKLNRVWPCAGFGRRHGSLVSIPGPSSLIENFDLRQQLGVFKRHNPVLDSLRRTNCSGFLHGFWSLWKSAPVVGSPDTLSQSSTLR